MTRTTNNLRLSRETVRELAGSDLGRAAGGIGTINGTCFTLPRNIGSCQSCITTNPIGG
ncbi:MAG TPA: hypothetical protein VG245_10250 [Candidatus Dormibacteraeota bacterium]|nr:hypothetical protein [Candidatus Dormibacteraeota bacterium]